jgi:hypothetical protein
MQTLGLDSPGSSCPLTAVSRQPHLTETDLVLFTGVTGMLETIFIARSGLEGAIQGQFVPAALTTA